MVGRLGWSRPRGMGGAASQRKDDRGRGPVRRAATTILHSMAGVAVGGGLGGGGVNEFMFAAPQIKDSEWYRVRAQGLGEGEDEREKATLFLSRVPKEGEEGYGTADKGRAVPIPVMSNEAVELLKGVEGFAGFRSSSSPSSLGAAGARAPASEGRFGRKKMTGSEVARALDDCRDVYRHLPYTSGSRVASSQVVNLECGPVSSPLDALASVASLSLCSLERLVVDEAETLCPPGEDQSIVLGSSLVFRLQAPGQLYGRATYEDEEMAVTVPLAMAVALASHLEMDIWLPRWVWREVACRVEVDQGQQRGNEMEVEEGMVENPVGRCVGMRISSTQAATWRTPSTAEQLLRRFDGDNVVGYGAAGEGGVERTAGGVELPEAVASKEVFKLSASEVMGLTKLQMRELLRRCGVASRRSDNEDVLLSKLSPLLDQVERGKIRLQLAVEREDYSEAQDLVESKSQRAFVAEQLEAAVGEERYDEAAYLQERYEIMTEGRADVTAEEGSYDAYLDADDWYMESIIRQRKKLLKDLEG
jgi:hypothetical protein